MKTVFVSGCYDILHAGHIEFFTQARSLGDHLTVCFASSEVLWLHKRRKPSLPDEHKKALIESLRMVDQVVIGENHQLGLDFADHFRRLRPDILAVTEDDQYADIKRALCVEVGAEYRCLPKTPPKFEPISTTRIVRYIQAPTEVPLRVDFAGGWLDVPSKAREDGYIVNCAISPLVSLRNWPYEKRSGLGGSGAWAILNGKPGVDSELDLGVGWQDPAVIRETGVCVWRSGPRPRLEFKRDGVFLQGRMALYWTGTDYDTPGVVDQNRDYDKIVKASAVARQAVLNADVKRLGEAVSMSYAVQMNERMRPLPEADDCLGRKYCGGGWGGYAVYLFTTPQARDAYVQADPETRRPIEPYLRTL